MERRSRTHLLLKATVFLSLLQLAFSCTADYRISLSSASDCVEVNYDGTTSCVSLVNALTQEPPRMLGVSCVKRLFFAPGGYTLSLPAANVTVNHSIIMAAEEGEVTLTCSRVPTADNGAKYKKGMLFQTVETNISCPSGIVELSRITFAKCKHSLKFVNLEKLTITNCTFRDFEVQTMDIYNVVELLVENSSFIGNLASALNEPYHGDSGGLSIGYHFSQPPQQQPYAVITGCTFRDNKAEVSQLVLDQQLEQLLTNHLYPARGGGVAIIITEDNVNVTMSIVDCQFVGNSAQTAGGGVYASVNGLNTNHSIVISKSRFGNNTSNAGAGIVVAFLSDNMLNIPSVVTVNECVFFGNVAQFAGGLLMIQTHRLGNGNYLKLSRSNFTQNRVEKEGSAVVFGSLVDVHSQTEVIFSIIDDCIFSDNTAAGGTVVAGFTSLNATGNILFQKNLGPSLRVVGSMIHVLGNLTFNDNDGRPESASALDISGFGQVRMFKEAAMNFINNKGTIGAAVGVTVQKFPLVYSRFLYNLQCFLLYENTTIPPAEWERGRIRFYGNKAQFGSAITVSYLDLCSWYTNNDTDPSEVFRVDKFPDWPIFEFGENRNVLHENQTDPKYYVQTPATTLVTPNDTIRLTPGQSGTLDISGLDQFGNPTIFIAQFLDAIESSTSSITDLFNTSVNVSSATDENAGIVRFVPSLIPVSSQFQNISYELELPRDSNIDADSYVNRSRPVTIAILDPTATIARDARVTLVITSCPPGYSLRIGEDGLATCLCVGAEDTPFAVLDCSAESNSVLLRNGYWAGYDLDDVEAIEPHLDVYPCPIPYCQCQRQPDDTCIAKFSYNDPEGNKQCHPPRFGTLCGSCGNGTIVTVLRMLCRDDCLWDKGFYITVTVFIIVDVVVIVGVLLGSVKFGLLLPHSLKPLLFYIQTVYIATEYFPISFWNARVAMLSIGNFVGLYFPYDFCFIGEAKPVWTFLPRFIPPMLVFVIPPFFLLFKRARLKVWNGVWLLILVTYAPLCYTCVMILNCPKLPHATSGQHEAPRWFLDASIECFSDYSHIIMAVLALIFLTGLVLLIPTIVILVVFQWKIQERFPIMRTVAKALTVGYKDNLQWWAGVELGRRLLLIVMVIALPGRTVVPLFMVSAIFAVQLYFKPYRHWLPNVIEAAIFINYTLFFIVRYPESILDILAKYSGTMVPSNFGQDLPSPDRITWFFVFGFYAPVFAGIIGSVIWLIWFIIKTVKHRKRKQSTIGFKSQYSVDMQENDDDDEAAPGVIINPSVNVVTSTDIGDILNSRYEEQMDEDNWIEITRDPQSQESEIEQ